MNAKTFHIDDRLNGASLAQAVKQLTGQSWTNAKRLITNRHVQVHGNLCLDEGRRLKTGDVVKVFDDSLAKPPAATDVAIVYRDAHLVIVEKPAGVTTQREAREKQDPRAQKQATLDELLTVRLQQMGPIREEPKPAAAKADAFLMRRRGTPTEPGDKPRTARIEVRPVHRLDRDTSGLMLFALSPAAETKLVAMFKHHEIERRYRAVVIGNITEPMTIESDLVRDRGDGLRGSSDDPKARDRQHAITHVTPIETIAGGAYTIVECKLETGRTHQIRIHLAERGHMLCGEQTYVRPHAGAAIVRDASGAPRHALHSASLALAHPISDVPLRFESAWPRDLGRWLERLR